MCFHLALLLLRNPKQLQTMTDTKVNYTVNKIKKMLENGDASVLRRSMPESDSMSSMTNEELCTKFLEFLGDSSVSISLDKKDAFWEGLDDDILFMELAFTFIRMNYSLFKSDGMEFVTNDNSVIPLHQHMSDFQQLRMPTIFLHSICPQLCFMLGNDGFGEETQRIDVYGVEQFNKAMIHGATRWVISSSYNARVHELVREEAKLRRL